MKHTHPNAILKRSFYSDEMRRNNPFQYETPNLKSQNSNII